MAEKKKMSLEDSMARLEEIVKEMEGEKLSLEKEYIGIYISGSLLDDYTKNIEAISPINIGYINDRGIISKFVCPSAVVAPGDKSLCSITYNKQFSDNAGVKHISRLKRPTRTMIFMDVYNEAQMYYNSSIDVEKYKKFFRHNKYTIATFADGHISMLRDYQVPHKISALPGYIESGYKAYFWCGDGSTDAESWY